MIRTDSFSTQPVRSVLQAFQGRSATEPAFRVGDILKGTVQNMLGKNLAAVRLGGMDLIAWTSQPLRAGEDITVRVEQLAPQLTVRLLPQEGDVQDRFAALFRLYLPQKIPWDEAVLHLTQSLDTVSAGLPSMQKAFAELESLLKAWFSGGLQVSTDHDIQVRLQQSGIFYESKLAEWIAQGKEGFLSAMAEGDLKGVLLKLDRQLGAELARLSQQAQPFPEQVPELFHAVKTLLANLELNQLANQWARENGGWTLYPFPGGESMGQSAIRLYVHRDKGEGEGQEQEKGRPDYFKLVLMLEPVNLGPLRVDLSVLGKHLSAHIYVASEETRSFLSGWLSELTEALRDAGFESRLETKTAEADFLTQKLEEGSAEEKPSGLLDLRA